MTKAGLSFACLIGVVPAAALAAKEPVPLSELGRLPQPGVAIVAIVGLAVLLALLASIVSSVIAYRLRPAQVLRG